MKKLVALTLVVCMMMGLTSCATKPEESRMNEESMKNKEVVLNFPCVWVASDSKAKVFGEMVTSFNEENEGKIKVVIEEQTDYQGYRDKIRTAITTGNPPDIFTFGNSMEIEDLVASGLLMDFAPHLDSEWENVFTDGAVESTMINGQLIALPYETSVFGVYYNEEQLRSVGYDQFPTTYEEMFDLAEKLKEKGLFAIPLMTGENAWTSQLWYSQILLAVGGPDVYKRGLDDPAFVESAKILKKMYDYTSSDAVGAGAPVVNGHFLNERGTIYMNGPWFIPRFATEGVEGFGEKVKVALPPAVEGGIGTHGGIVGGGPLARLAAAKQENPAKQEAVIKFMKYITNPERVAELAFSSGSMFMIKMETNPNENPLKTDLVALVNEAPYMVPAIYDQFPQPVINEFPQALDALVLGTVDAQGFVDLLKAANQ